MRLLGYTRVSTASQDAQLQLDALVDSGVQKRDVFADVTSGSRTAIERPGMKRLLDYVESGDTVVVYPRCLIARFCPTNPYRSRL
ncbi:recombinase family protein [Dietzia sp. SL131]|jgi:DNA invertase Pin-like site-specific DNA recombinase|uniref:recombinase family protein n=1 Tax=unclassified Dietzia TaxID=2617939 RepID=UPI001F50AF53|nr:MULTISPECIES: recombinase family protein [Dietzia]MCY1656533.1 recombinase family protein [Dietzia sp. SL131]